MTSPQTFHADAGASDISARDAWAMLAGHPGAQLIDVRTEAEWATVGCPDLSSLRKETRRLSWKHGPSMARNSEFEARLMDAIPERNTPLLFLCRSGGRSWDAAIAMAARGYARCYNIGEGFEGRPDDQGRRGTVSGWKAEGLPWTRS